MKYCLRDSDRLKLGFDMKASSQQSEWGLNARAGTTSRKPREPSGRYRLALTNIREGSHHRNA